MEHPPSSSPANRRSSSLLRAGALIALFGAILAACGPFVLNPTDLPTVPIRFNPAPPEGITFDDMAYDPGLGKLIVPLDGTGRLALLDPKTLDVKYIDGFSKINPTTNGQGGSTSATVAHGLIYALDNSALKIQVIDPNKGAIIGSVDVQSFPDFIRYVAVTNELWVTEGDPEQIEVFSLNNPSSPVPVSTGAISVPNGPEYLIIDNSHGLAYTNQPPNGTTAVIQVQTHDVIAQWGNGCSSARGMALDVEQGWLFVACSEGKVVILDTANNGHQVSSINYGGGLDLVAYNPKLHHVYIPSGTSSVMGIFGINIGPRATRTPNLHAPATPTPPPNLPTSTITIVTIMLRLGTVDTGDKDRCIVNDDQGHVWVCDSANDQLLMISDNFPDTSYGWQRNP
jgi:hypothetical protein